MSEGRQDGLDVGRGYIIPASELSESFIRASGPGGQNVNKVASAVQLRFQFSENTSLPDDVKRRLARLAGSRLTLSGEILIQSDRFRSQERNREDAMQRLAALVRKAFERPKPRKATRPTKGSKERRLKAKKQRGATKKLRSTAID
ncbi:alternative ribosome rescue aminoacyl-tRNA hydrolase ArfB [Stappia sp. ES.058]|uniref:alternative ribosome rescue aminoacyl-tRNA hydrolase ArfB n=1 Tax=Stappia sp. ES.058 TaxID=1881061 RepID=UPI0008798FB9|nr:alternative ribosome rescue aminoacyl-tRNA hydrolase ArfB [Stappia sp. ES.058]SDU10231.1 ribosome-associated protein [Stappia sp. ES.058]